MLTVGYYFRVHNRNNIMYAIYCSIIGVSKE